MCSRPTKPWGGGGGGDRDARAGIRGVSTPTVVTVGRIDGYAQKAAGELCLLVQIETQALGLDNLEAIAAVDGVDGVFIGPADLAASLGHPGGSGLPEVKAVIEQAIGRIVAAGRPAGILTPDLAFADRCMALGTLFTAVGVDVGILARETERLAARFRDGTA